MWLNATEYLGVRNLAVLSDSGFIRLTVYYFIFSIIPTFRRVVKRQHHSYHHSDFDGIFEYLSVPDLECGAIAKMS
jgi:hypothetical protein